MQAKFIPEHSKLLTKKEIKSIIAENNIEFIRLQFCDLNGAVKNLAVPATQIDKVLNNEVMLDGSSIKGFRSIETSDMYFYPDLSTFAILPWRGTESSNVARIICDIHNQDGTPFEGCPRCNLKRVIAKAKALGYEMNVGPEAEFFIFKKDACGEATTIPHDDAGYYDTAPYDLGENFRADMVKTLTKMGFEIEASHHEVSQGQHEIDFKYSNALTTADNIVTFKYAVKAMAGKHNLHATFMPKPIFGINGSGMHCNISLFKDGENLFYNADRTYQLSKEALYTIGGLLKHVKAFTSVTNPLVNSYKRLVPGYEAPVYLAWSLANRSALIRVPAKRGNATRVELRSPDPSCNPYLALAVLIEAAMDGIKNKIEPPLQVEENIYDMTPKELKRNKINSLPGSLFEAIELTEKSELVKEALGAHIFHEFLATKRREWDKYRTYVSPLELDMYLKAY
ncbi:MAG: type I glutamate--ammonia ligase [Candidatus Gastranaerophilales bacterium]|nr:type I glutamate--ammonia ligase [Candidatus Gastranaerophilales bacterium]